MQALEAADEALAAEEAPPPLSSRRSLLTLLATQLHHASTEGYDHIMSRPEMIQREIEALQVEFSMSTIPEADFHRKTALLNRMLAATKASHSTATYWH